MATLGLQHPHLPVHSGRVLRLADGCGRLECHSHNDVFPIADAALNATASIGGGAEAALFLDECVVVCRSPHFHSLESTADLEAFGRGDREHGVSELSLNRLSGKSCQDTSSLSKHGSPSPTGQLRMTHVTMPPVESLASRHATISSSIAATTLASSGQRTNVLSMSARVSGRVSRSVEARTVPTPLTQATISTPYLVFKTFSAIAPAATRPIVSRALLRPPPLLALTPYLY
mmetsp:Transcript_39591/g.85713  ORF Transcript_39591/g.85713 Transcript_39591/m.85713 type:complete len:232 (+) Transcript_39591:187-882(+)